MASKVERAKYGPSLLEVTLGALLSVVLGILLAVVYLILKPVQIVKVLPKEKERPAYTVYYIEGSKDSGRGRQWLRKRQIFVEGGSVSLTEDELNTWVTGGAPAAKASEAAAAKAALIEAAPPTFRIHDGILQIGVPCKISALGANLQIVAQAEGKFVSKGGGFVFEPNKLYLGSCPFNRFAGSSLGVLKKFMTLPEMPEDVAAAWKKITDVSIEGSTLKLTMP